MADFNGERLNVNYTIEQGSQALLAQARLVALPSSLINPIPRYKLSCYDDTNTRRYWVDSSVSLANAPDGFTYISATLVVEGRY